MAVELQEHIFMDVVNFSRNIVAVNMTKNMLITIRCDRTQKISHKKVMLLFPNATMYVNDQAQNISIRR